MNVLRPRPWTGWAVLAVVLAITAFFGQYARIDRIDNRLEDNVVADDRLEAYYRYLKAFGNDRILLVAFEVASIDAPLVRRLFDTELELLALPQVQTVLSPVTPLRAELGLTDRIMLDKFLAEDRQLDRYLENLRQTTSLDQLIISRDWRVGGMVIRLDQESGDLVGESIAAVCKVLDRSLPVRYQMTGVPEITRILLELTRRDQRLFSPMTLLVVALVLIVLYRSWFGLLMPLLAIISSLIWTKGLLLYQDHAINFVTAIVPPMVLSIALTYCIHILTEYFEESRGDPEFEPARLWAALGRVVRPILLSAFTTVVGFGSLTTNPVGAIVQFGWYSGIGTIFASLLSLVILPAAIIARRRVGEKVTAIDHLEPRIEALARACLRHPGRVWLLTAVLLAVSAWGIYLLPIETSLIRYVPVDHPVQEANRFVERHLCGIVPVEILLESRGRRWTEPEMIHRVRRLQEDLASVTMLDRTLSYVNLVQDFDRMFSGEPDHIPRTEEEICDYLSFYAPPQAATGPTVAPAGAAVAAGWAVASAGDSLAGGPVADGAPGVASAPTDDDDEDHASGPADLSATGAASISATVSVADKLFAAAMDALASRTLATEAVSGTDVAGDGRPANVVPPGGLLAEFLTADGRTAHVSCRLRDCTSRDLVTAFAEMETLIARHFGDLPASAAVAVTVTGRARMWAEVAEILVYNEIQSFGMSLVVISVVIALFFRSVKLGLVAMLPNVLPMFYTYGAMGLAGATFNTVTGMIASVAIGLAVDDTIHIICKFQDELAVDGDEREALVRTMVHKGRATCFASFVLGAGFSVLMLSGFAPTRYFGIFITFGVTAALVCELVLTPVALLTFRPIPIPPQPPRPDGDDHRRLAVPPVAGGETGAGPPGSAG